MRNAKYAMKQLINFRKYIPTIFLLSVICYLLFLIRPALSGQLGGMFKTTKVPQDYIKLEKFLYNQPSFFRTLWFPSKQHFGYYSNTHPEISAQILFNAFDDKSLFKNLSDRGVDKLLEEASIKYVIVPYDSEKEIFITDRKYDNTRYQKTISRLREVRWLKQVSIPCGQITDSRQQRTDNREQICGFGRIAVFEIGNPRDHFWSPSTQIEINYKFINPTKYIVNVNNAKKGDRLVFSEKFDEYWQAQQITDGGRQTSANKLESSRFSIFNSFILPENGNYSLEVYYEPQKWVDIGTIISGISLFIIIIVLLTDWRIADDGLRIKFAIRNTQSKN